MKAVPSEGAALLQATTMGAFVTYGIASFQTALCRPPLAPCRSSLPQSGADRGVDKVHSACSTTHTSPLPPQQGIPNYLGRL